MFAGATAQRVFTRNARTSSIPKSRVVWAPEDTPERLIEVVDRRSYLFVPQVMQLIERRFWLGNELIARIDQSGLEDLQQWGLSQLQLVGTLTVSRISTLTLICPASVVSRSDVS